MERGNDKQRGNEVMKMRGLFEGSADLTALQRLRRPVVVHHAAWSLSFSSEEQAAELCHLEEDTRTKKDKELQAFRSH